VPSMLVVNTADTTTCYYAFWSGLSCHFFESMSPLLLHIHTQRNTVDYLWIDIVF
jgi:hypothetical protein